MRAVRKVSSHFEYLGNRSRGLDVTWHPVGGDLTVCPWTVTPLGLVTQQWDAIDWACVLCDRHIHNDWASRSASSWQCACPFYSSRAKHHITQVCQPPYNPDLWLLAFPEAKIAVESEEISECNGHTVHEVSQQCLTAERLAPRESDCSRMHSKVSSDWLPSCIRALRPVLEIFKTARYFLDSPCIWTLPIIGGMPDIHNVLGVDSTCFETLFCAVCVIIHKS